MKHIFAFILLGLVTPPAFAVGIDQLKQFCKNDNTKRDVLDEHMYNYCLNRQVEGIAEIKSIINEFKGKRWFETTSGPNCFNAWTKRELVDYTMVAHCMRQEKEGFLDTKYQYEKKDKDIAVDCLISQLSFDTPMEMTAYCIKNYSTANKVKADNLMENYARSNNSVVKDAKAARKLIEQKFFGKDDEKFTSTLPELPDTKGLVADNPAPPKPEVAKETKSGPGLLDKVKGWFNSDRKTASTNGCPTDKTKNNFMATCGAYLQYQDISASKNPQDKQNHETCRCVALNFNVENVPTPPNCEFDFQDVGAIMKNDSVQLKCR